MAYQSKTWSLSDEVVAEIERRVGAIEKGSPNKVLKQVLGINFGCPKCGAASVGVVRGAPVFDCCQFDNGGVTISDCEPEE